MLAHLLQHQVRFGTAPNEPRLLESYLRLCDECAADGDPLQQTDIYQRAYELLLETICDTSIPWHWRCLCLDHIHRPAFALNRLARGRVQLRAATARLRELNLLSEYFLGRCPDW